MLLWTLWKKVVLLTKLFWWQPLNFHNWCCLTASWSFSFGYIRNQLSPSDIRLDWATVKWLLYTAKAISAVPCLNRVYADADTAFKVFHLVCKFKMRELFFRPLNFATFWGNYSHVCFIISLMAVRTRKLCILCIALFSFWQISQSNSLISLPDTMISRTSSS